MTNIELANIKHAKRLIIAELTDTLRQTALNGDRILTLEDALDHLTHTDVPLSDIGADDFLKALNEANNYAIDSHIDNLWDTPAEDFDGNRQEDIDARIAEWEAQRNGRANLLKQLKKFAATL